MLILLYQFIMSYCFLCILGWCALRIHLKSFVFLQPRSHGSFFFFHFTFYNNCICSLFNHFLPVFLKNNFNFLAFSKNHYT